MKPVKIIVISAFVVFLGLCVSGCTNTDDKTVTIRGAITYDGVPLNKAAYTITGPDSFNGVTDGIGYYSVNIERGEYLFRINYAGTAWYEYRLNANKSKIVDIAIPGWGI